MSPNIFTTLKIKLIRSNCLSYLFAMTLLCCLFCTNIIGQNKKTAEQLYEDFGYKMAIQQYEKINDLSQEEMEKIANSYRLNGDYGNAQVWYAVVTRNSSNPIHFLHFAQALQANGNLEDARNYYLKYHELRGGRSNDNRGKLLANAIDRISEFRHVGIEVVNEKIINSNSLDFSPSFTSNGIVFVSSRGEGGNADNKDIWMDKFFMDLYFAEKKEDGSLSKPSLFSNELLTKFHEGPVVFSRDDQKIYFTRNQYNRGKRKNNSKGVMKQDIFSASKTGDGWSDARELSFNTIEYEEVHPAIFVSGVQMIFSSDRPGGYGKMDLYIVNFENGRWGAPINLGPNVNTAGNELFPFVHEDETIYFSSDGWGGLGGLDIYSVFILDDSVKNKAYNLGTPLNSEKDDFGFIINTSKTEGYFSSSRANGLGLDDIYSFKIANPQVLKPDFLHTVCVYDEETNKRLTNVKVTVSPINDINVDPPINDNFLMRLVETEQEGEYILKLKQDAPSFSDKFRPTYRTDESGEFVVGLDANNAYEFKIEKEGYFAYTGRKEINSDKPTEFCFPLRKKNCLVLKGTVFNASYDGKTLPKVDVTLMNYCSGETQTVQSDEEGNFYFDCIECGCDFKLLGEKANFTSGTDQVSSLNRDCSKGGQINSKIYLKPSLSLDSPLAKGDIIELQNIFYDFDEYYIRDDAVPDMDKVVAIMYQYPNLILELGSHTDSRGTIKYNEVLSQNRANAAVEYIIRRGIEKRRIIAMGYGESKLRNNCSDNVYCTEEEHQFNRRTEIKVLHNPDKNLDVQYIDNKPSYIDEAPFSAQRMSNSKALSQNYNFKRLSYKQPEFNSRPSSSVFKVQFVVRSFPNIPYPELEDIAPITVEKIPGKNIYRYFLGNTSNLQSARRILSNVRKKGNRRAFIVEYKNSDRVRIYK